MPQFMEVRAMANPPIPPGKIYSSTNQGTGRKGRVDGEQQKNDGKSTEAESQLTASAPLTSTRFVVAELCPST